LPITRRLSITRWLSIARRLLTKITVTIIISLSYFICYVLLEFMASCIQLFYWNWITRAHFQSINIYLSICWCYSLKTIS
jgi:hypothetical protein